MPVFLAVLCQRQVSVSFPVGLYVSVSSSVCVSDCVRLCPSVCVGLFVGLLRLQAEGGF